MGKAVSEVVSVKMKGNDGPPMRRLWTGVVIAANLFNSMVIEMYDDKFLYHKFFRLSNSVFYFFKFRCFILDKFEKAENQ